MDLTRKASIAIRRVGILNSFRFIRYARFRDRLERQARRFDSQRSQPTTPGVLKADKEIQSGGHFQFENSSLEIKFLADDLVRISWSPGKAPMLYGIAKEDWPPVRTILRPVGEGWTVKSEHLEIMVGFDGGIHFSDLAGRRLRTDFPPERGDPVNLVQGSSFHEPRWTLRSHLEPEAAIYGLGLRAFPLNLRGRSFRMWNSDPPGGYGPGVDPLYLCIPVYLAVHQKGSYLVFFENSYPATFWFPPEELARSGDRYSGSEIEKAEVTFEGGMLRYYFVPGPPDRAIERYSELTGRAPLPPRWALGYHQSRWGYENEADIREVAGGFKEYDLPISAIHLDIDYMHGFRMFTVDEEKFPNFLDLAQDLERQDIHLVAVVDPCVKLDPGFRLYQEGVERKVFCRLPGEKILKALVWPGWSVFPDFTDPLVREWWGCQYAPLISKGIAGVWHDMNEPATFAAWGDLTLPVNTVHAMEGRGGTHLEAHNLYGQLMNQAGREALEKIHPEKRPWLLTRSGWAGVARYAWSWTGDTESSWEALRQTIPALLGLSLSGIPYCGSDIGGFLGIPDAELYLRWFQLAVFTPFFRLHSAKEVPPREPWRYGEPVLGIVRESLRLRYRLIPYLYTLAWECEKKGLPLVRPLFWPDARDPRLWDLDDAFLLGDKLLVAPVLEPGSESRRVILPDGDWYDFWDDSLLHGSAEIELPTCLERIPLLVRAGSLLPLEEQGILQLHLYPAGQETNTGSLYSDAGDGYGDWRLDCFESTPVEGGFEIRRTKEGLFTFPYRQFQIHVHGMGLSRAWVDGNESPVKGNSVEAGDFERIRLSGIV